MYNMRVSICALELFSTFTHGFSQSNIESFVVIIIINNFFTPFFHLKILFEQLFNFAIVISTIEDHFSVAKKIGRRDARTKMATSTMNFKPQILTKKATRQARSILQRKRDFDCYPCPPPSSFYRERILSADVSSRLFHGQLFDKRKRIKEDRDARKKRRLLLLVSSGMPTIPNKVH